MFYYFSIEFTDAFNYLNLFNYITFRAGAAILTSLFFSLIFGGFIIDKLLSFQPIGQPIRLDGPENHLIKKAGTPTMGGLLILSSMTISLFLWANLTNKFVWICLISSITFGLIGFIDDFKKIKLQNHKGIKASTRIIIQLILSLFIVYFIR